ncbi:hypothetical protein B0I35DRAFT_438188 [Stachybotrys elegans]|uniref:PLD phosphodiesterase domain-containing protein n=1 Tax=Stachybotrys elegans TaxID=80388 RepID=A0A8K0WMV8_9HYPO|nr:hypothetical protein B0I35DRAFT_438188 [Stachybotrys elegans]
MLNQDKLTSASRHFVIANPNFNPRCIDNVFVSAMAPTGEFPESFTRPWKQLLRAHRDEQIDDFPNSHVTDVDALITTSVPKTLYVGTGLSIFERAILPAILGAQSSVHLVTCYWADSPTLDALGQTLVQLAKSRAAAPQKPPLRLTFGFSSRGLFQKLFHTSSRHGHVYPPSQWPSIGLPDEETMRQAGIEMTVKTLFFTPVSVMHPKYLIVDGSRAWVPSCNISWERWFEGCIELEGDIVTQLKAFHRDVWKADIDLGANEVIQPSPSPRSASTNPNSATQSLCFPPHEPPMTPLNTAILTLIENAQHQITLITPNVTSWPVIEALLQAVKRGVDVQIRTSKGMMLIEQLVTAGTTTSWCLNAFIKRYKQLVEQVRSQDIEARGSPCGTLEILYYTPLEERQGEEDEPVVSHFKMTMVDHEYLVLGSGNMDRASWWTSQEIGVLFHVPNFEGHRLWEPVLDKRTEVLFRSWG